MRNETEKWFKVQNGDRIDIHTKDEQGYEKVVCYGVMSDEAADMILKAVNPHQRTNTY